MKTTVSIDNVSFTAKIDNHFSTGINEFLSSGYVDCKYWYSPSNFLYQQNFSFPDGTFFQYGEFQNDNHARLEFNPNKCDQVLIRKITSRLKYPKVTRLDFAVDYFDIDLSRYIFDSNTARTTERISSRSGKLETLYIGSRRSDKFTRIYDKAKEVNKRKKKEEEDEVIVEGHWWRVEAVVKDFSSTVEKEVYTKNSIGETVKEVQKVKVDGNLFKNPFEVLISERKEKMSDGLKTSEKAMLFYLQHNPSEWDELTPNTRKKYKYLEFAYSYELIDRQPHDLFEKEKNRLAKELESWLKPAIDNGTYLTGVRTNLQDSIDYINTIN